MDGQTDRQTNSPENITFLAEVITRKVKDLNFQKISFYLICAGQGAEICVDAAYSNSPKYAPSYWDSHVQMQGGKKWLGDFSQT